MLRLFLLLALWVAGCASNPPSPQLATRPEKAELSSFSLSGRIAVRHDNDRSFVGMHWSHNANREDEILLLAPLGQTVARINRTADVVELDTSGKQYFAENAEALTQQILGWRLPLDGLRYWVLALPEPGSKVDIERDANNRVSLMKQDGWEIRYPKYALQTPDSLPQHMTLQREGLEIDLLIDAWEMQ
ncbi:MAG: lipoprotein insertase outer membrane protein LolB [Gallionellaceae bacterium]